MWSFMSFVVNFVSLYRFGAGGMLGSWFFLNLFWLTYSYGNVCGSKLLQQFSFVFVLMSIFMSVFVGEFSWKRVFFLFLVASVYFILYCVSKKVKKHLPEWFLSLMDVARGLAPFFILGSMILGGTLFANMDLAWCCDRCDILGSGCMLTMHSPRVVPLSPFFSVLGNQVFPPLMSKAWSFMGKWWSSSGEIPVNALVSLKSAPFAILLHPSRAQFYSDGVLSVLGQPIIHYSPCMFLSLNLKLYLPWSEVPLYFNTYKWISTLFACEGFEKYITYYGGDFKGATILGWSNYVRSMHSAWMFYDCMLDEVLCKSVDVNFKMGLFGSLNGISVETLKELNEKFDVGLDFSHISRIDRHNTPWPIHTYTEDGWVDGPILFHSR